MELRAIVEIPLGSRMKFEYDKERKKLVLDRTLNQPIPFNYGYLEHTLEMDGDPADIFILCEEAIPPLTEVKVNVFGMIKCIDNGVRDDKLLATIVGDDLQPGFGTSLIVNYLKTYKSGFEVEEIVGIEEAERTYLESVDRYTEQLLKASTDLLNHSSNTIG